MKKFDFLSCLHLDSLLGLLQVQYMFSKFDMSGIILRLAASIAPIRSYIAQASYQSERTIQFSFTQAAQSVGFTIGPGIQAAFAPIGCSSQASSGSPYFSLDTYTSWWMACITSFGVAILVLFLPSIFVEHNVMFASADKSKSSHKSFLQRKNNLNYIVFHSI